MMMPSFVVSFLLLFFILNEAQGICLEKGFLQVGHRNVKEDKSPSTETKNENINGVIVCHDEVHCTGMNRKLATVTNTISTATPKNEKSGESKAHPMYRGVLIIGEMGFEQEKVITNSSPGSGHQEVIHDHDVDIAEMDYSPAKRKPPIHN